MGSCFVANREPVVPGGNTPRLLQEDEDGTSRWTLEGDPQAVLDACGVTAQMAKDADVAYDPANPASAYWDGLGELILGTQRP